VEARLEGEERGEVALHWERDEDDVHAYPAMHKKSDAWRAPYTKQLCQGTNVALNVWFLSHGGYATNFTDYGYCVGRIL
jgi:hypothetical protein